MLLLLIFVEGTCSTRIPCWSWSHLKPRLILWRGVGVWYIWFCISSHCFFWEYSASTEDSGGFKCWLASLSCVDCTLQIGLLWGYWASFEGSFCTAPIGTCCTKAHANNKLYALDTCWYTRTCGMFWWKCEMSTGLFRLFSTRKHLDTKFLITQDF